MNRMIMLILVFCFSVTTSQAEEIIISTGSGPLDSVIKPVKDAFEKESGVKLNVLFGSASLAFKQFYNGVSEVAIVGTDFDDVLQIMKKEGFEVADPAVYRQITLGRGMVRTIVHKDNPVSKLSKEQLKGIFTGKISSWKEVGGKDTPIIVVLSNLNPATNGTFRRSILNAEPFTKDVLELGNMDELRSAVEVNVEAIAFGTSAILSAGVKQVETPEVFRPVTLISKGAPSPKVQRFIDFILQGPGKGLVKE